MSDEYFDEERNDGIIIPVPDVPDEMDDLSRPLTATEIEGVQPPETPDIIMPGGLAMPLASPLAVFVDVFPLPENGPVFTVLRMETNQGSQMFFLTREMLVNVIDRLELALEEHDAEERKNLLATAPRNRQERRHGRNN